LYQRPVQVALRSGPDGLAARAGGGESPATLEHRRRPNQVRRFSGYRGRSRSASARSRARASQSVPGKTACGRGRAPPRILAADGLDIDRPIEWNARFRVAIAGMGTLLLDWRKRLKWLAGVSYMPGHGHEMSPVATARAQLFSEMASDAGRRNFGNKKSVPAVLCVNVSTVRPVRASRAIARHGCSQFWAVRSMGGCMDAMMVARGGQADLGIETSGQALGISPREDHRREAGGQITSISTEGRDAMGQLW